MRAGSFEDHDGHDFQPDDEFAWSGEIAEWWRYWTGDPAAGVPPFRVFGQPLPEIGDHRFDIPAAEGRPHGRRGRIGAP